MSSIISKLINLAGNISGILPVVNGGSGVATSTGSTNNVLSDSPTLVTPTLGAATATSINKMAITAPATSSTLAVANGKTFTASNTLTLAGTDSTTMTFPSTTSTVMTLASTDNCTGVKTFAGGCAVGDNTHTLGVTLNNSTASYSPSVLNFYEEYTTAIAVGNLSVSTGGGSFSAVSGTMRVTRIGKIVTVTLDAFAFTTSSSVIGIIIQALIPARFRPAAFATLPLMDVGNGGTGVFIAPTVVGSNGNLQLATINNAAANASITNAAYTYYYTGSYTL